MKVTISQGTNSPAGKGCATLFLGIFAMMGLVFTILMTVAGFKTVRPYLWDRTECVIETSDLREEGDGFEFAVRYTYRVNGQHYTGARFRLGMSSGTDAAESQRAAARYVAGSRAECFVNPSSPEESALERASLWPMLFILLPLVFVAIGVGGIVGVWRAKPATEKAISESRGPGCAGVIGLRVFGLFFMCIGGGVMYVMLIGPTLKEAAAATWPQVPCEILSSRVASHRGSKGGSTYSVEIRYRYEFSGLTYTGTRHNFASGSSSSRKWRAAAVADFPAGTRTLCYVNPADPIDAVLSVKPSPDRWFGLLPGLFLVAGSLIFWKAPAMAGRAAPRTGISDALPALPQDRVTGEAELKPASTPMAGFVGLLIVALFWNGIVWAFLLNLPRGEWFGRIFRTYPKVCVLGDWLGCR